MSVPLEQGIACGAVGNPLNCRLDRQLVQAQAMAGSTSIIVDIRDLETHRQALFKFAMMQLRNETHAEDCVQETLVAAIQGAQRFSGGSSVRTWLIGILKHKIIDHFRKASRYLSQGMDKDMSAADRTALRMHLAVCDACNKLKAQFVFLRRAISVLAGRGEPPPS